MNELIYKDETYQIIGAAMEVHKELGCGFTEAVYQEALEIEFKIQCIPNIREQLLNIFYKDHKLKKHFSPDFICYNKIIVEVKATEFFIDKDVCQVLNYLNVTKFKLGILINFGSKSLEFKRFIL